MNELKIFENLEFGKIRAVEKDGEPWFVAADVCRALDIVNANQGLKLWCFALDQAALHKKKQNL